MSVPEYNERLMVFFPHKLNALRSDQFQNTRLHQQSDCDLPKIP